MLTKFSSHKTYPRSDASVFSVDTFVFFYSHIDSQLRHSDSFRFSLDPYNLFISTILDASKVAIPVKGKLRRFSSTSLIWRDLPCTEFARVRSASFKKFKRTGFIVDRNAYKKFYFSVRRTFLNAKRNSWKSFCSPLVLVLLFLSFDQLKKKLKNCVY